MNGPLRTEMELHITDYHPHNYIKQIAEGLNNESKRDCLEEILELPKKFGKGTITGFEFSDGVGLLFFDCMLREDWILSFPEDIPSALQFNFSVKGGIKHFYDDHNIQYFLNPLQGTITANPLKSKQNIQLPGNQELVFACLIIDRQLYREKIECIVDSMPDKLRAVFEDTEGKNSFFYQGNYSITSSECIQEIRNDEHEGLVRSTYLEGVSLELLSYQAKQYLDDQKSPGKQLALRKQDVEKILEAKELLLQNLDESLTIEELSREVGINQTKLKTGFKKVFDKPVKTWLRDKKLEKAKLLLLEGKLSVREIASSIGYTNQSHFSNKFKEKYGVLPKDYSKSIELKLAEVE